MQGQPKWSRREDKRRRAVRIGSQQIQSTVKKAGLELGLELESLVDISRVKRSLGFRVLDVCNAVPLVSRLFVVMRDGVLRK